MEGVQGTGAARSGGGLISIEGLLVSNETGCEEGEKYYGWVLEFIEVIVWVAFKYNLSLALADDRVSRSL